MTNDIVTLHCTGLVMVVDDCLYYIFLLKYRKYSMYFGQSIYDSNQIKCIGVVWQPKAWITQSPSHKVEVVF